MTSKLKCPYSEEELKEIRNNFNGNKLVCPFCGRKLGRKNIDDRMCSNEKCVTWKGNFYGSEDLWQELIRTRKELAVAVDKLKGIKAYYDDSYADPHFVNWHIVAQRLANDAEDSIKAITALEQKDVKC